MTSAHQLVLDRVRENRGMRKQAVAILPLIYGALAANGIYGAYKANRDYMGGYGGAEDLHGFAGEDGMIRTRPGMLGPSLAELSWFVPFKPFKFLRKVPYLGRATNGFISDIVAHSALNAGLNGLFEKNPMKTTENYYKMRQALADAGITVGRNGSDGGIVNNFKTAPKHVKARFTGEQKQKLMQHMIDPRTGAPFAGWKDALKGKDPTAFNMQRRIG